MLARALGGELRADVDALNSTNYDTGNLFGVWITQGLTDPSHTYPYLLQGGLGMPDRDYYISPSPQMAEICWTSNIWRISKRCSSWRALRIRMGARGAPMFALETAMAKVHATRTEDPRTFIRQASWRS